MVTMDVRKVMVETWQPRPEVRSSKRSDPRAQIDEKRMGVNRGNVLDKGSMGSGKHVEDCRWSSVFAHIDCIAQFNDFEMFKV
jgi:hypothetical protein